MSQGLASYSPSKRAAIKLAIEDIRSGENRDAARVNVIGVVISCGENRCILDDGTGQISITHPNANRLKLGYIVMVIGQAVVGTNRADWYISGNILKVVDPLWMKIRKQELGQRRSIGIPEKSAAAVQNRDSDALDYILTLVKRLDAGNGVAMEDIVQKSMIKEGRQIIESLMSRGDIFEIEPGKIKVLE